MPKYGVKKYRGRPAIQTTIVDKEDLPFRIVGQEADQPERHRKAGTLRGSTVVAVKRPEGIRFYKGHGAAEADEKGEDTALMLSEHAALTKARDVPSDSLRTADLNKVINPKHTSKVLKLLKSTPDYFRKRDPRL